MRISFVVAMSENRVIGKDGKLPWYLPNDFKHFREITLNRNVLMGRRTFESLKKPLDKRQNFVLSKNLSYKVPSGVSLFHSKEDVQKSGLEDVMVIGGEEIFRLFLPECQKIYLTLVHAYFSGDTFFPEFSGFVEMSRKYNATDVKHAIPYTFKELLTLHKKDLKS